MHGESTNLVDEIFSVIQPFSHCLGEVFETLLLHDRILELHVEKLVHGRLDLFAIFEKVALVVLPMTLLQVREESRATLRRELGGEFRRDPGFRSAKGSHMLHL